MTIRLHRWKLKKVELFEGEKKNCYYRKYYKSIYDAEFNQTFEDGAMILELENCWIATYTGVDFNEEKERIFDTLWEAILWVDAKLLELCYRVDQPLVYIEEENGQK